MTAGRDRSEELRWRDSHACRGYSFCQGPVPCEDCPDAVVDADAAWLDACEGMSEPQPGDRCTWCNPAGCQWPQCTTAGDSRPTVALRRMRAPTPLPSLPWWRRALLWLFPT